LFHTEYELTPVYAVGIRLPLPGNSL